MKSASTSTATAISCVATTSIGSVAAGTSGSSSAASVRCLTRVLAGGDKRGNSASTSSATACLPPASRSPRRRFGGSSHESPGFTSKGGADQEGQPRSGRTCGAGSDGQGQASPPPARATCQYRPGGRQSHPVEELLQATVAVAHELRTALQRDAHSAPQNSVHSVLSTKRVQPVIVLMAQRK